MGGPVLLSDDRDVGVDRGYLRRMRRYPWPLATDGAVALTSTAARDADELEVEMFLFRIESGRTARKSSRSTEFLLP